MAKPYVKEETVRRIKKMLEENGGNIEWVMSTEPWTNLHKHFMNRFERKHDKRIGLLVAEGKSTDEINFTLKGIDLESAAIDILNIDNTQLTVDEMILGKDVNKTEDISSVIEEVSVTEFEPEKENVDIETQNKNNIDKEDVNMSKEAVQIKEKEVVETKSGSEIADTIMSTVSKVIGVSEDKLKGVTSEIVKLVMSEINDSSDDGEVKTVCENEKVSEPEKQLFVNKQKVIETEPVDVVLGETTDLNITAESSEEDESETSCLLTEVPEVTREPVTLETIDKELTDEFIADAEHEMVPVKYTSKYGAEIVQYERKDGIPNYYPGMVVTIDPCVTKTYL